MGVCSSSDGGARIAGTPDHSNGGLLSVSGGSTKSSMKWKEKLSKSDARKVYEADGTIAPGSDSNLLQLRVYLDYPMLLGRLGQFCKDKPSVSVLMCWVDVLEFKHINEEGVDYQVSKAFHIYHKYIKAAAVLSIQEFVPLLTDEWRKEVHDILLEARNSKDGVPKRLFDEFHQQCLQAIYTELFAPFRKSAMYQASVKEATAQYNVVSPDDFEYYDILGEGSYGVVVRCRKKSTNKEYALKIQSKIGMLECFSDCPNRVVHEKEALQICHHPFIVSMDYAMQTEHLALMVMDLATGGTLADAVSVAPITEDRVRFYSAEIILALVHMHRMGMIYRDLKPSNILLNGDGHIQLVDLGGVIDVGGRALGYIPARDADLFAPEDAKNNEHSSGGFFRKLEDTFRRKPRADGNSSGRLSSGKSPPPQRFLTSDGSGGLKWNLSPPPGEGRQILLDSIGSRAKASNSPVPGTSSRFSKRSPNPNRSSSKQTKSPYRMAEVPTLRRAKSIMGTFGYMAPEMLVMLAQDFTEKIGYGRAVDFWSLGVTMFYLLTRQLPFENAKVASFVDYISKAAEDSAHEGGYRNYPPEYIGVFRSLVRLNNISKPCMNAITEFLEFDESKRLGNNAKEVYTSVQNVKAHPFYADIDFNLLAQKHVIPPHIPPPVSEAYDEHKFEDFQDMMKKIHLDEWTSVRPMAAEQFYFASWDYISPSILKIELGIAAEMDDFDSNFKQEVLPTSTVLGKGLSILSAMGNTFQGLISNADPPLSTLKSTSRKNGDMSYEDSPAGVISKGTSSSVVPVLSI